MFSENKTFYYSAKNFIYVTSWQNPNNLSKFDELVNNYWKHAMDNNYFRFRMNIYKTKHLKGTYGFVAQLNLQRRKTKRKSQDIRSMDEPFNPNIFNFTHIPDYEIISILKEWQEGENDGGKDVIAINVSPLAKNHCLIIPQVDKQLPQILSPHAAKLALHILLLSANPSLRLGFNSLCAFSSVNHLHLHSFLLPEKMVLETILLKPLAGPCYEVIDYAVKGFAFEEELRCSDDISTLARYTHTLTSFFQKRNISHNVNWTRSGHEADDERRKVRVYVWARQHCDLKVPKAFHPALCEFFGLLDFRDEKEYEIATEEYASRILAEAVSSTFDDVRSLVYDLFSHSEE